MNEVPRTFCVTLRETPKRREEAQTYFDEVGFKAEFFCGVHGPSFGLRSTVPNYDILPGREYFISQGAVGCILSHLMLWNVLINQPEDEFLIVEDDIKLCDGFEEKFTKFKSELPADWEIAYVGWLVPDNRVGSDVTHVSENVAILKPIGTHAYMVKKSALKTLVETNQLAWSPLDRQMCERSLPKLKYYASKDPLIGQRSVFNVQDEVWYSLCNDWDLKPEWLANSNANTIRLGNGWHPLEKNDEGYMIWSDGRGEFIFDDKWTKMDVDFIFEGDVDKKMRVICPQQAEQIFDLPNYGLHHLSIPLNGASSVILVSDTFRPIDIFKTSDSRRLGIRLLKGITLTDTEGKSKFISLYSMYGAKKVEEMSKVEGIKVVKIRYSHADGKVNIRGQFSYNHHRSGWKYALEQLAAYQRDDATVFDTWLERAFSWERHKYSKLRLTPYREPWIGVFHNPPNIPSWISDTDTPYAMINTREFQDSLPTCKGLYVLSKYHENFLKCFLKTVPIETLYLPTETPELKFSFDEFVKNNSKKVINIGWWCRKLSSIYQLDTDRDVYQKVRLLPATTWVPPQRVEKVAEVESCFRGSELTEAMKSSVIDLRHMEDSDYDDLMSKNIVFLDLYDASANNVIVECIARGTPVLVNPLPAVVEYLGTEYPFYFTTLVDASKKIKNLPLIKATNEYLMTPAVREKVTGDYFIKTMREGAIWKSLQ